MNSVLITGAGSGIGAACARAFSQLGFRVLLLGRSRDKLEKTAQQLSTPSQLLAIDLCQDDFSQVFENFLSHAQLDKYPLASVINNAGVFKKQAFVDSTDSDWMDIFRTNLLGPVRVARCCFKYLKACPNSSLVNVSSTLSFRPMAGTAPYSALKAALNQFTQVLALEWAPMNIRVNVVSPGIVDTPIQSFHTTAKDHPARKMAENAQPLARVGKPEEIAQAVVFLATENSAWTTGAQLNVDGGISLL